MGELLVRDVDGVLLGLGQTCYLWQGLRVDLRSTIWQLLIALFALRPGYNLACRLDSCRVYLLIVLYLGLELLVVEILQLYWVCNIHSGRSIFEFGAILCVCDLVDI